MINNWLIKMRTIIRVNIILLFLLLAEIMCTAQSNDTINTYSLPKNSIYVEGAGTAVVYSLNYERVNNSYRSLYISERIGASFWSYYDYKALRVPILLNLIMHCYKALCIEIGAGISLSYNFAKLNTASSVKQGIQLLGVSNVGLRFQAENGFLFRAGFVPLLDFNNNNFKPYFGVSLGYSFGGNN